MAANVERLAAALRSGAPRAEEATVRGRTPSRSALRSPARLSSSRRRSISSSAGPRGCSRSSPPRRSWSSVAAVVRVPRRLEARVARLLPPVISAVGLTALVAAVYLVVVLGLGRPPTHEERTAARALDRRCRRQRAAVRTGAPAARRLLEPARARRARRARRAPPDVRRAALPRHPARRAPAPARGIAAVARSRSIRPRSGPAPAGVLERIASEPERGPAAAPADRVRGSDPRARRRLRSGPSRRLAAAAARRPGRRARARRSDGARRGALRPDRRRTRGRRRAVRRAGRRASSPNWRVRSALALRNVAARLGPAGLARRSFAGRPTSFALSRARVVAAADAERRRIERDLHDGAQQHLVALEANLGAVARAHRLGPRGSARRFSASFAPRSRRRCRTSATSPTASTRRCSRIGACPRRSRNAARRATIPARLDAATAGRYDPEVEATVYFCCLEALQNAAKHAGDGRPRHDPALGEGGRLRFEVADDGSGLDPASTAFGAGLTNMRDRLGAIGGDLRIESSLGRARASSGTIPLER